MATKIGDRRTICERILLHFQAGDLSRDQCLIALKQQLHIPVPQLKQIFALLGREEL